LPWRALFLFDAFAVAAVLDWGAALDFVGAFAFAASGAIVMFVSEND
jgi:hypothetical protein